MRISRFCHVLIVAIIFTVFMSANCWANGKDGHDHGHEMSDHMKAMYALKESVPKEYQLMERTPIVPDEESLKIGARLFNQQCAVCHGEQGRGDGPAAKSLKTKPADFLDQGHSAIYGPGEKFWIIGNGSGETGMPAFPNLSLVDRWNLVNHIYQLQEAGPDKEKLDHHH